MRNRTALTDIAQVLEVRHIECVDNLVYKFNSDVGFVLIVLATSTAFISRLPIEDLIHFEI